MSQLKQIVGLDIGARNVRAVWMRLRDGRPHVTRTAQMALPLEGGDPAALVRTWLGSQGLLNGFAAVQISGVKLVFQPGRLNPDDPRTPRQAADMELATFNDMAGDNMLADVAAHEWSPQLRIYLLAMARPAVVGEALGELEPLGLRPAELAPAPAALFNALMPLAPSRDGPTLIVNIGHNQTELAIGTSRGILFARSFAMGGKAFTEAVAKDAGGSMTQAETQKHREGTIEEGGPLSAALRPVAERWHNQLSACLSGYRGSFTGERFGLQGMILSGGGSRLRGLREYVAERLGLDVVLADGLTVPGADAEEGTAAAGQFDLAAGLAIMGLEAGIAHLSLLPENLRGEAVFRDKKPYLIAASIMGALTLGVVTASMVLSMRGEMTGLDEERRELRRREQMDKSITSIRQRGTLIRQRAEPLRRLLLGGPVMREVISLVANAIAPGDWISMICEETSYKARPRDGQSAPAPVAAPRTGFFVPGFRSAPKSAAPATSEAGSLLAQLEPAPPPSDFTVYIIEGYTPDMSLTPVKEMILRLETSPRVRKVDLLSDDRVLPPTLPEELLAEGVQLPNMRRFVIRLEAVLP